jgi:hypothetical protein
VVLEDDEVFVKNYEDTDILPNDPGEKKVVAHDFGKQPERFPVDIRREMDFENDEILLEKDLLPKKVVKGVLPFDKGPERFPDEQNKDPFHDDKPVTDLKLDVDKAL